MRLFHLFFIIFSKQNIKSYWIIIIFKLFLIFDMQWKTYFFPIVFIYKRYKVSYFFWTIVNIFGVSWFVIAYWKHFYHYFSDFFFYFYLVRKMFLSSATRWTYSMTFVIHFINTIKNETAILRWCFKPIWDLVRNELKAC